MAGWSVRSWNVRATGVLAGERPLGFAVPNEVNARNGYHFSDTLIRALVLRVGER